MSDTRPAAPDNASLNALLDAMLEVAREVLAEGTHMQSKAALLEAIDDAVDSELTGMREAHAALERRVTAMEGYLDPHGERQWVQGHEERETAQAGRKKPDDRMGGEPAETQPVPAPAPEFHCPSCGAPAIVTARRHVYPCPFDGDEVGQESRSDNVACCCVPVPSDWICGEPSPAPEPPVRPDPFSDYPCMPEPIMDDPAPEPSEEAMRAAVCSEPCNNRYHRSRPAPDCETCMRVALRAAYAVDMPRLEREAGERMVRRFAVWLDDEQERMQGSDTGRALAERFLKEGA